jgi:hypothetical protein
MKAGSWIWGMSVCVWCGVACGDVVVATDAAFNHCHITVTRCPGASVPRTAGELSRAADIPRACLLTRP